MLTFIENTNYTLSHTRPMKTFAMQVGKVEITGNTNDHKQQM